MTTIDMKKLLASFIFATLLLGSTGVAFAQTGTQTTDDSELIAVYQQLITELTLLLQQLESAKNMPVVPTGLSSTSSITESVATTTEPSTGSTTPIVVQIINQASQLQVQQESQQTAAVPVLPTLPCSLSATTTMDSAYWMNTYGFYPPKANTNPLVQFSWSYPKGATGVITGENLNDSLVTTRYEGLYPGNGIFDHMASDFAGFRVVTKPYDKVFTLTVSAPNAATTTCSTEVIM